MNCIFCNKETNNVFTNGTNTICVCEECCGALTSNNYRAMLVLSHQNDFNEVLDTALTNWFVYKEERKEGYSGRGKQSFLSRVKNEVKATSEEVVAQKIQNSIDHKWQGVCWEDNSYLKPELLKMFEITFAECPNKNDKESAKKQWLYSFHTIGDKDIATKKARIIYAKFKAYVDNLEDERYCKTFEKWLKANVPTE